MNHTLASFENIFFDVRKSLIEEINPTQKLKFLNAFYESNYSDIFKQINDDKSGIVLGFFDVPYSKTLGADVFKYESIEPTITSIPKQKNIKTVLLGSHSRGFDDKSIVALFPESFKGNKVSGDDSVFYFLNRFIERHNKFTKKVLPHCYHSEIFRDLVEYEGCKSGIVANWVTLHEHFHRKGCYPIPEYLYEKSTSFSAALEELRVDVLSMLYCLENNHCEENHITFLYILAERMYCYPLTRESDSFDSISSIILFSFLKRNNVIESIKASLEDLSETIQEIEKKSFLSECKVKNRLMLKENIREFYNRINNKNEELFSLKRYV